MNNKSITSPRGFLASGVSCGIKRSGKLDLGLLVCPSGAKTAAMFTTNKIVSAAVETSKKHLAGKKVFAVVVNSGNANACTGQKGLKDALKMCQETARHIESEQKQVLVASTGIIGEPIPIQKVVAGIKRASDRLSSSASAGLNFAKAIMTTDTKTKQAWRELVISGKKVAIAGTVKGAGMIAPNMATTLCFITTDIEITTQLLKKAFREAIGNSLNKLTVDGHQSTNDTAVILSSGLAGNRPIIKQCPRYRKFKKALVDLCDDLAKQMAMDAEGATRIFKVVINEASSKSDAQKAARAIADYPLVKCAINGTDPNWGRIICAVGSCGVKLNPGKLTCKLGDIIVFKNGRPTKFNTKKAISVISKSEHTITVSLGAGRQNDFCYGCDLSKRYVQINSDYHT